MRISDREMRLSHSYPERVETKPGTGRLDDWSGAPSFQRCTQLQPQRIQANAYGSVGLILASCIGFRRGDFWIVEACRALATGDDDIAFI